MENENFSFGLGRDMVSLNGILPKRLYHGEAPGPGRYPISSTKSKISYSFRKKLNEPVTSNMSAPAPDRYEVPLSINKEGNYQQSKWINSRAPKISTTQGSRFKSFDTNIHNPAPGHYPAIAGLDKEGKYPISKYKNSLCRSFSQASRNSVYFNHIRNALLRFKEIFQKNVICEN